MKKGPYKMKGSPMQRNFPSAFKEKPTEAEILDAVNNPKSKNHKSKFASDAEYFAWKEGHVLAPNTYHGAGGTVPDSEFLNKKR